MEPETATIIAIVSVAIAGIALLWTVYSHVSSRKIAKLTYEVSQLSDFGVPESFLSDMPRAPLAITVTSRGNKGTENIILRIKTKSPIENFEASPADLPIIHVDNELSIQLTRLNPSQQIKLFLRCNGAASEDQISEINLSHSEGAGINEQDMTTIIISFMGIELEYDPRNLKTHITQLGPISFR